MSDSVVRVRGVDKVFGTGTDKTPALQHIDLEIPKGAFVSLIGPSGCGKSTLLRLIGDLTQPSVGAIDVNGKTAHRARLDRDYGMVFQAPVLFDWRTVQGNVELPLEVSAKDKAVRAARARAMLALVELTGFERRYPWQLSGGMQQRVAIARALSYYAPAVLVVGGVLGPWELAVRAFGIQQFLLPPPSSIAGAFVEHFDELVTVGRNTLTEAVGGLLIGGVAALVVAFAIARWATASRALLPFAIAANSVPIIAFAPIMNNWFGILSPLSKMMVVAVLVFFPSMIIRPRGLRVVGQGWRGPVGPCTGVVSARSR